MNNETELQSVPTKKEESGGNSYGGYNAPGYTAPVYPEPGEFAELDDDDAQLPF